LEKLLLGLLDQGLAAPIPSQQAQIMGIAPKDLLLPQPKQILGPSQGQPGGRQLRRLGLAMEQPHESLQV
jgi:hypothetical protein